MKRFISGAVIIFALVAASCISPIEIRYDYDTRANFSVYRTFSWMKPPATPPGGREGGIPRSSLQGRRIREITADILTAKGLKENPDDPDMLIVYHTGVRNRTVFESWGYGFGPFWGFFGPRSLDSYTYREGTLVLDFVDAKNKELIWRGVAVGLVTDEGGTPEERVARFRDALNKILSHYPPR